MTRKCLFWVGILAFLLAGSLPAQEKPSADYRIGARDILQVNVFGVQELNTEVRVSEDGKITLPMVGEVEIEGLTKTEVEQKLANLLLKWLQEPQVTVFIKEYASRMVYVQGAVSKPGSFPLLGKQTLRQLISQAGGFTPAAGDEIIVLRQSPGGQGASLTISIDDLMIKGDPRVNIPIEPNDYINVPMDRMITIYVMGQVRNPSALEFKKSSQPTLLKAITKAGGFTDRADRGDVRIKRKDANGKDIEIKVNCKDIIKNKKADIPLLPEDIIYVGESLF